MDSIHTLVDTAFMAPGRQHPSPSMMTFIALIFTLYNHPLLSLRSQIARPLGILGRCLELLKKVFVVRQ